jgi:hypothetical protein
MTEDRDGKRMVQIRMPRAHLEFLEKERRRLKTSYGINVSIPELIEGLVELHKMRMIQLATRDRDSVAWFHRLLVDNGKV